ncbi:hypothetical protein [Dyella mobilis]|uniref:DUF2188 domain-containing protein n=1 Tax=Dyella mobilis TaxID=1849582 RepID=A0ABS2KIB4_9GAMM|nr:hypothetical protein [Dyella mobilis]MBM7130684.1 hypothetical protein [Dyella mobilis]GLQ97307.1 hypothetical protein GCM10007863_17270 [Dyella mobilis]
MPFKIWECEAGHWWKHATVDSVEEAVSAAEAIETRGFGAAFIQAAQESARIPLSEFREKMKEDGKIR